MNSPRITHIRAPQIIRAGVFDNITSLNVLAFNIIKYGQDASDVGDDTYANRVGWAYEVYAESFMKHGLKGHPTFGITSVQGTSQTPYQGGFDFTYHDVDDNLGLVQVKFRSNPLDTFTRHELGTFVSWADELGVPASRRVLFTNLKHVPCDGAGGIFHGSYASGEKQMRVFGRIEQEAIIDRDPKFWP
jgi:hypothetical protein